MEKKMPPVLLLWAFLRNVKAENFYYIFLRTLLDRALLSLIGNPPPPQLLELKIINETINPVQGEVVRIRTRSQPNEEAQDLTKLSHQTKKTFLMLSYKDMTDEIVEPMLSTLLAYEPNHETALLPISDTYGVTASLISLPRPSKITNTMWVPVNRSNGNEDSWKHMTLDYVKRSYSEVIHFTLDEITDVSLKHRLMSLKLQDKTHKNDSKKLSAT